MEQQWSQGQVETGEQSQTFRNNRKRKKLRVCVCVCAHECVWVCVFDCRSSAHRFKSHDWWYHWTRVVTPEYRPVCCLEQFNVVTHSLLVLSSVQTLYLDKWIPIYFPNNPAMRIGLRPIAMICLGYNSPHENIGPILFTYANNQHLIESNNNTTMVSVVITTDHEAEQIAFSFRFFGHCLLSL